MFYSLLSLHHVHLMLQCCATDVTQFLSLSVLQSLVTSSCSFDVRMSATEVTQFMSLSVLQSLVTSSCSFDVTILCNWRHTVPVTKCSTVSCHFVMFIWCHNIVQLTTRCSSSLSVLQFPVTSSCSFDVTICASLSQVKSRHCLHSTGYNSSLSQVKSRHCLLLAG
jgi:hypothetical protein